MCAKRVMKGRRASVQCPLPVVWRRVVAKYAMARASVCADNADVSQTADTGQLENIFINWIFVTTLPF